MIATTRSSRDRPGHHAQLDQRGPPPRHRHDGVYLRASRCSRRSWPSAWPPSPSASACWSSSAGRRPRSTAPCGRTSSPSHSGVRSCRSPTRTNARMLSISRPAGGGAELSPAPTSTSATPTRASDEFVPVTASSGVTAPGPAGAPAEPLHRSAGQAPWRRRVIGGGRRGRRGGLSRGGLRRGRRAGGRGGGRGARGGRGRRTPLHPELLVLRPADPSVLDLGPQVPAWFEQGLVPAARPWHRTSWPRRSPLTEPPPAFRRHRRA